MNFNYFKNEITRSYQFLGVKAFTQNARYIDNWYNAGLITLDTYTRLNILNRNMRRRYGIE